MLRACSLLYVEIFAEVSFKKHILTEDKGLQLSLYKVVEENQTTGRRKKREFDELEVNNNWGVQLSIMIT